MLKVDIREQTYRQGFLKKGHNVLENVRFNVNAGEIVLVAAPSGIGKTTLLKCIMDRIAYKGQVEDTKSSFQYAFCDQQVAVNLQETVFESVYFSFRLAQPFENKEFARKKVWEILSLLKIKALTNKKNEKLSGGQLRRVQIAMQLALGTPNIILDEPDSGLDILTSYELLKDLANIAHVEHKKIIVVSHNMVSENVGLYDKILFLAKNRNGVGSIAYFGKPEDILSYFEADSMLEVYRILQTKAQAGYGMGSVYCERYEKSPAAARGFLHTIQGGKAEEPEEDDDLFEFMFAEWEGTI